TGRRGNKRQLTPAYDLCADFRIPDLVSHLDAVASAHEGQFAACILFCSDGAGLNDDHRDRASRWNPQRGGNAVTSTEQSPNEFKSDVKKVNWGAFYLEWRKFWCRVPFRFRSALKLRQNCGS